jgi:Polyketide cyclase / dehydrase and lipid transport
MDIDRNAPVIARHEIGINAPLETVWRLHTDVDNWPVWQPDIASAQLTGPFAAGSEFRWLTHGLDITSTIYEVVPNHRIVWGGTSLGITGVHLWLFTEGTIHTEESWDGDPIRADVPGMQKALDGSLETWLRRLKETAEQ